MIRPKCMYDIIRMLRAAPKIFIRIKMCYKYVKKILITHTCIICFSFINKAFEKNVAGTVKILTGQLKCAKDLSLFRVANFKQ